MYIYTNICEDIYIYIHTYIYIYIFNHMPEHSICAGRTLRMRSLRLHANTNTIIPAKHPHRKGLRIP